MVQIMWKSQVNAGIPGGALVMHHGIHTELLPGTKYADRSLDKQSMLSLSYRCRLRHHFEPLGTSVKE